MLPIFLVVGILGGCVAIFFLREKRKSPAPSTPHPESVPPDSSHRKARAKVSAFTEESKALHTGTFNDEKTGAKRNQFEQIKKFATVT
jgi:hypothetical protein